MPRRRFKTEQIIAKLREVEVQINQGRTVAEASRQIDVSEQTYYKWRKEYVSLNDSLSEPQHLICRGKYLGTVLHP